MRTFWQFVCTLFIVGLVGHFIWWIVAAAALVWLVWLLRRGYLQAQADGAAERARRGELAARADEQHQRAIAGDPRGIYGAAWPAVRKYQRRLR